MFTVSYKLVNDDSVSYDFDTKEERDLFKKGVDAAIMWPQRTHKGVWDSETQPAPAKPEVKKVVLEPVVEEKKPEVK